VLASQVFGEDAEAIYRYYHLPPILLWDPYHLSILNEQIGVSKSNNIPAH